MVLFRITTHYQLLCALIVKMQVIPEKEADLHLDTTTDFSPYIEYLKKLNIFRKIVINDQMDICVEYMKKDAGEKSKFFNTVADIWNIDIDIQYEDIYLGHDMIPHKMFFYYLKKLGQNPKIHILDEGVACYYKNILRSCETDPIDHKKHSEKDRYENNIVEQFLHNPNLYMNRVPWSVRAVPCISDETANAYMSLYESRDNGEIPEQQYLFLADGYSGETSIEYVYNNNADLLDICADIVGKDDIIVKKHPLHDAGSSLLHGYKVWSVNIPWEYYLLKYDMSDKIMISTSSVACISPLLVFHKPLTIVYTSNCYLGGSWSGIMGMNNKNQFDFIRKCMKEYNTDNKYIFMPNGVEQLKETMIYINGKYGKER